MFHALLQTFRRFTPARRRTRPAPRRFRPRLEALEDRTLLATIVWSGKGANDNWSTPGNWVGGIKPGSSDTVVLGAVANGDRENANMDYPNSPGGDGFKLNTLILKDSYTGILDIQNYLIVTSKFVMHNGFILLRSNTGLILKSATSVWEGGTIGGGIIGLSVAGGSLKIEETHLGRVPTLLASHLRLMDGAQVNWKAGDFYLPNALGLPSSIDINAGTTLEINSRGRMVDPGGAWSLSNRGKVIKKGAGTATMENVNYKDEGFGKTDIQAGKLDRIKPAPGGGRGGDASQVVYLQEQGATLTIAAGATLEDVGVVTLHGETDNSGTYNVSGATSATVDQGGRVDEHDNSELDAPTNGAFLVGDGGTLGSDNYSTVVGNLNNFGGTVIIGQEEGAAGSSHLIVNGSFQQGSGGSLVLGIGSGLTPDQLNAWVAVVGGQLAVSAKEGFGPVNQDVITRVPVVTAVVSVSGEFNPYSPSGMPPSHLEYDPNTVYVVFGQSTVQTIHVVLVDIIRLGDTFQVNGGGGAARQPCPKPKLRRVPRVPRIPSGLTFRVRR